MSWTPRADGAGNEITGITQAQMDAYSSRTEAIKDATPAAVAASTEAHGREPNQRELLHIQQDVTMATRNGKPEGSIDWDEYTRHWDATLGGNLAKIAVKLCEAGKSEPAAGGRPDRQAEAIAARTALAQAQAKGSSWTRADLMRQVGLAMRLPRLGARTRRSW